MPDLTPENHGTICLIRPENEVGRRWLRDTAPEGAFFAGDALVVEPRYVFGVLDAAYNDGLVV